MKRNSKIVTLWLLTMCGFAYHSIADMMPMFWGKSISIASDGLVDYGMIVMIITISFLMPVCGIFSVITEMKGKTLKIVNTVLAVLIALFNVAHACMELPSENTAQYLVMPLLIIIGLLLAFHSFKYVKEE